MHRKILSYRQTQHLDLDDPVMTELRREILGKNLLLRKIYCSWYAEIQGEIPHIEGEILELGTGAGFLRDYLPNLITSEILEIRGVDLVVNATTLPFGDESLRAVIMTNVLHHIPKVSNFFMEADRCLVKGGKVILIEPWISDWSRLIYARLHHEAIDPEAPTWDFALEGPLSSANEALPWIVFWRDRLTFEKEYPQLSISRLDPIMPFVYLMSGGFTSRFHFPGYSFPIWHKVEQALSRWRNRLAMFAIIVLNKR